MGRSSVDVGPWTARDLRDLSGRPRRICIFRCQIHETDDQQARRENPIDPGESDDGTEDLADMSGTDTP